MIASFLKERTFKILVNSQYSNLMKISAGVPQGSILGPILYNVYTHDIPHFNSVEVAMYADDTALISQNFDIQQATDDLQIAIDLYCQWCDTWKIVLNTSKCQAKIFTLRRPTNSVQLQVNTAAVPWNANDSAVKYLGMFLDRKLTWGIHINKKLSECYTRLSLLYPLINRKSKLKITCSTLLYKSLIRPIIMYGSVIWGTASKTHINKIQVMQNKILRIICNASWFVRNDQLHTELQIPHIEEIIKVSATNFFNNVHNCPSAIIHQLDTPPPMRKLKRRVPMELILASDNSIESE